MVTNPQTRWVPMIWLCLLAFAAPARAQSAPRITLAAVAGSMAIDADQAEGRRPLVGAAVYLRLNPWADLEAEIDFAPGAISREFTGPLIAFGPPSASFEEFASRAVIARTTQERATQALYSIGVVLHPPSRGRFQPRAFVGLTGHRVRDTRRIEIITLPPGVAQAEVDRALPNQPPWTHNVGGVTVGGGVAIALTDRVSLVPDVRYDYGSFGDEINNALRTTMRVAWRF